MNLYVASSWRNKYQPGIVQLLRDAGHAVYDFRHPKPGDDGFSWGDIAAEWKNWTPAQYKDALGTERAAGGFANDCDAMHRADGCVLVLPAGRSAHLEAGWFIGRCRPVWIYVPEPVEPELMYLLQGREYIVLLESELLKSISQWRTS